MIETLFLVPMRDNEGALFPRPVWRELHARLLGEFGAYTRTDRVQGVWTYEGRVYRDTSRQYIVALTSWNQFPTWLDIVRWVRVAFRQEAIYIRVAGIPEVLGAQS